MSVRNEGRAYLGRGVEARLGQARAAIVWERLWPALWPAAGAAGFDQFLSLIGFGRIVPGWFHWLAFAVFAMVVGVLLYRAILGLPRVGREWAMARVEKESGLAHRPLTALSDQLAGNSNDPGTRELWHAHRAAMRRRARKLKFVLPVPGLARKDPWALRSAVALLLFIGLAVAGEQWLLRVEEGVTPELERVAALPASFDAWITPPEYTRLPPVFLSAAGAKKKEALRVPAGAKLLLRVHGGHRAPVLLLDGEELEVKTVEDSNFEAAAVIGEGITRTEHSSLEIRQDGREMASWQLLIVPDQPPAAAFQTRPSVTEQRAVRFDYRVRDDYGVAALEARLKRPESPGGKPERVALSLPGNRVMDAIDTSYHDLTPHKWAGLEVEIRLAARDETGQTGVSQAVLVTLPERDFTHPVARAIVGERKRLAAEAGQAPAVAAALAAIARDSASYDHDPTVTLNLADASWRLHYNQSEEAIAAVLNQLWDTALRLEDGALSLAQREFRSTYQALLDALSHGAPDAAVTRLMNELEEALDRYMRALQESTAMMSERLPGPGNRNLVRTEDLKRLLDRARELQATGARDAARALLARLHALLENLQRNPVAGGQGEIGQTMRDLRELGQLAGRQQALLDEAFRESQELFPDPTELGGQARDQENLRRSLGDLMTRLGEDGEIPQPLGKAERAMRGAREALSQGAPRAAMTRQAEALENLREGAESLVADLLERYGPAMGQFGAQPGGLGQGTDPLGRPTPFGSGATDRLDMVPDEADTQRARTILQELRRRASQLDRPKAERDYLNTLLRRF